MPGKCEHVRRSVQLMPRSPKDEQGGAGRADSKVSRVADGEAQAGQGWAGRVLVTVLLQLDVGSGAKVLKSVRYINFCPSQLGQTDNILQWRRGVERAW